MKNFTAPVIFSLGHKIWKSTYALECYNTKRIVFLKKEDLMIDRWNRELTLFS